MSTTRDHKFQPAVLPELEQLLVRAAGRRAARRLPRRRWVLAVAVGAFVLAAAAAAATGVLNITSGRTANGTFMVERATIPGEEHVGTICLQLRFDGRGPSYGCGKPPSVPKPFGLVVADPLEEGAAERVIYGLVAGNIDRISVLGSGGERTEENTEEKEGLPGRFFAVVVPHLGRIELVGTDGAGREVARIGNLAEPPHPPLSKAEAIAQGDPAGFAPTIPPATRFLFRGRSISKAEVDRLNLSCVQGREVDHCHRSMAEVEAGDR